MSVLLINMHYKLFFLIVLVSKKIIIVRLQLTEIINTYKDNFTK